MEGRLDTRFSHFASVFPVDDLKKTAEYYRDKLGFTINFEWGEPPTYAIVKRGESVSVHFTKKEDGYQPSKSQPAIYIFVYDVDAIYKELTSKGVEIVNPINDREYGMRDFDIKDLNGYILAFSTHVS